MLVLYTTSAFCGSSVIFRHVSPASSDRYTPSPLSVAYSVCTVVEAVAYSRCGSLAATPTLICTRPGGNPFVSCFHVVPPSVDLNRPPPVPGYAFASSHGPSVSSHIDAYTTRGFLGSITTPDPPTLSFL